MSRQAEPDGYVSYVEPDFIHVVCSGSETCELLQRVGFKRRLRALLSWEKSISSKEEMAAVFASLRDWGFAFSTGRDWSPVAVFQQLRDEKLLDGKFNALAWLGSGKWQILENQ